MVDAKQPSGEAVAPKCADESEETFLIGKRRTPAASEVPEYVHATLSIVLGKDTGRVFELKSPLAIIGRDDDAEIQLDDQGISRRHASVSYHHDEREFRVNDLESSNGTLLNGSRVSSYALRHGDKVLVGETLLLFEVARPESSP